jgi:glycine oxidase
MKAARESADVVIVGGGVMGCAIALSLAESDIRAVVLERSVPGAEASSAAAGILGAQLEAHADGPFLRLCVESRARFSRTVALLKELTGIDCEWRPSGVLRAALTDEETASLAEIEKIHRSAGLSAELLDRQAVLRREPAMGPGIVAGLLFKDDARIDPPSYMRALRIAAERKGARFLSGNMVKRVVIDGTEVRGVELENSETVATPQVVIAAGSWSGLVGGAVPPSSIRPARGQIVELRVPMPILRTVISGARGYLSPRDDGRILLGSTLEFVGFEKIVTAEAVRTLLDAAIELVPSLGSAELCRAWSNFRPFTRDELPLIGHTSTRGLCLATGHYRNGILLSPITAEIVRTLILGAAPPVDIQPFSPGRLSST